MRGEALPGGAATRAEALRAYARACRRARQHDEAARAWRAVLAHGHSPAHVAREAAEALAIHHELRLRDLDAARQLALETLESAGSAARRDAARRRLARIERKLGRGEGSVGESLG
jgi:sugar (pentulose or hexulose) kinase